LNKGLFHRLIPLAAFLAVSGAVFSCEEPSSEDGKPLEPLTLTLKTPTTSQRSGSGWVVVTSSSQWTISIKEQDASWVELSVPSCSGNKSNIVLSWDENKSGEARTCTIVLSDGVDTVTAVFTQNSSTLSYDLTPDTVTNWMELPAMSEGLYFFTHPMTIDGKRLRNYSFGWSADNLVARWVAYPLNSRLKSGSSGRSEAWGLDPKLPRACQPVIYSAFRSFGARGHQIPSADRQISQYNIETFYGTNMTPQDYDFNSGVWASLEGYVRDRSASFDTLYVVTGCTVAGSTRKAYDNDGKPVTVPTGYFKALLGYKKSGTIGRTGAQGGYTARGFYFLNQNSYSSYQSQSMTISELENKVGLDFFVNLPAAIGADLARKVESTADSWWN